MRLKGKNEAEVDFSIDRKANKNGSSSKWIILNYKNSIIIYYKHNCTFYDTFFRFIYFPKTKN